MPRLRPNRTSVTTINQDGSRNFLHPADVDGFFTRWRRVLAVFLIAIYIALPWIPVNGHPAVLLDVMNLRFHLFGFTFATQDLWLVFFFITGLGFALFFVTALFGRIWCGAACPQTVFLEHVYRRIERWIEGDAPKRRALDRAAVDKQKIRKRLLKHGLFIFISVLIAHIFLSYFVPLPELYRWMTTSPLQHWGAFLGVFATSGVLYFNFAWFREQLCLVICPYGRLQSALIDDDSIIIGYDEQRGEPRGPPNRTDVGDCIDCDRCVQVCPTGIDIRQGLQMECIGCANCIDACNNIMAKLGRPPGLIRYDSMNGLAGGKTRYLRPRIILYAVLLLIGAAAMTVSAMQLSSVHTNITRMGGAHYFASEENIRNQYMIRIINKTDKARTYTIRPESTNPAYRLEDADRRIQVPAMGEEVRPVILTIDRSAYEGAFTARLSIQDDAGKQHATETVRFLGPDPEQTSGNDKEAPRQP